MVDIQLGHNNLRKLLSRQQILGWCEIALSLLLGLGGLSLGFPVSAQAEKPEQLNQLMQTRVCIKCNLEKANLAGAALPGAILRDTKLKQANLKDADLRFAILRNVNLQKADLTNADLTGAILREVNLDGAILTGTKLPAGFRVNSDQSRDRKFPQIKIPEGLNLPTLPIDPAKLLEKLP